MADLKTKLGLLAGVAALCAGSAFAQSAPTLDPSITFAAQYIRAEGTTEKLPQTSYNVTNAVNGTVGFTVNLPAGTTITSKTYGSSTPKTSEVTAWTNDAPLVLVSGTVSGNQVIFSGIATTTATTKITVDNIRIDATAFPVVAGGTGTPISEFGVLTSGGSNVSISGTFVAAYVTPGVTGIKASGTAASNTVCTAVAAGTTQFTVNFAEAFSKAFKTLAEESGSNASAPADNGTRLQIVFTNVPKNVKVYVPLSVGSDTAGHAGFLTLIKDATVATAPGNAVTAASGGPAGLGAVSLTFATGATVGSGTAYYELTTPTAPGVYENFPVAVSFVSDAGAVAPSTAVIATVGFAATGKVPNFSTSVDSAAVTGSTYSPCSTYLLFPYVTDVVDFETGLAISNTSLDSLGTSGASLASKQTGGCTLSFFGNKDSNGNAGTNPPDVPTGAIAAGTTWGGVLSTLTNQDNFTGYMIANCNFQYAHGFAYISYGPGGSIGAAMGYVASPLNGSATTRSVGVGASESLGQ